jgi:hypothetical protein
VKPRIDIQALTPGIYRRMVAFDQSVAAGYVTGGLTMLLAVPPLLLRRMRERADVVVGQKAGQPAARRAQGLPQGALVDTTARQPVGSTP